MNNLFKPLISQIPNSMTVLNLLCGSLATAFAMQGQLTAAALMIILGYLFDLFDGLAARLLHVQSPMGKELDSLADLISFGLAPAAILFGIHQQMNGLGPLDLSLPASSWIFSLVPFLLPVFAGWRLAKFNIDEDQADQFIGLPTPANGLMVMALPLALHYQPESFLISWLESGIFIPAYSILISLLMVSPIRLYSLKIKGFAWSKSKLTYLLILGGLPLVILFGITGIFLCIPYYFIYTAVLSILKSR